MISKTLYRQRKRIQPDSWYAMRCVTTGLKTSYVVVRVNGIYSEYIEEDLEAVVRARPDAIRIPKVEYGKEVKSIASRISEIEKKAGIEEGSIKLWCNIESYMGVLNAKGKSPWPIRGWKRWHWGLKISRPAWEL